MTSDKNIQTAHDQLQLLGELTVKFADIHRATIYPDGHHENDTEHSFHLALTATELAATYHPELNVGLVSQYCTVHDLPEVYAGDVPSYKMTAEQQTAKEKAEQQALEQLLRELPPHTARLLKQYELQTEPEARFVRFVDKLLPPVIYVAALTANHKYYRERFDIHTMQDAIAADQAYYDKLQAMFPEFDFLLHLRVAVANTLNKKLFPNP